jgi:iron complex outermembrane receptor protein
MRANVNVVVPALSAIALASSVGQSLAETQNDSTQVQELIVTAQRRTERAIDVPQTVNVATQVQLTTAGVTNSTELAQVIPGVNAAASGFIPSQPVIRGVGNTPTGPGTSGATAIYIDGVYQPSQGEASFDLSDVASVQVLKGPQGTLYGRNAIGGVVLITTADPSPTQSGELNAGYGNYNQFQVSGHVTGRLAGPFSASLAGSWDSMNGWQYDIFRNTRVGDNHEYNVRGKLLWDLGGDNRIVFSADHSYRSNPTSFDNNALNGDTSQAQTPVGGSTTIKPGPLNPALIVATGPTNLALNFDPFVHDTFTQLSAKGDFDFPSFHLQSISAANRNVVDFMLDSDFTNVNASTTHETFTEKELSQEFIFTSRGDHRLSWIGGLSYVYQWNGLNFESAKIVGRTTDDSLGAFVEFTYRLTDKLKLVAGARYTYEIQQYSANNVSQTIVIPNQKLTAGIVTPRVSLSYALSDEASVYATFSQGYQNGGWNISSLSRTPYQPEHITAYEVGTKARIAQVLLNAAVFYYDFANLQEASVVFTGNPPTTLSTIYQNAGKSTSYGAEFDADWRVTHGLTLDVGAAYTHAVFDTFNGALFTQPIFGQSGTVVPGSNPTKYYVCAIGYTAACGNSQFPVNAAGKTVPRAPKLTLYFAPTYTFGTDIGRFALSANFAYQSTVYFDAGDRAQQPPYWTVNARAAFTPASSPVQVAIWAKNLLDVRVPEFIASSTLGDRVLYTEPRTYGVTLSTKW